ncbi:uncharacterized protein LOC143031655 [Oratosquilla oratoria]|uniref:uncharacterized protein LOC143031655 n=1 Tax=Oratosquilla oratoria TaxID=337810 RepID=UPI003F764ECB
MPCYYLSSPINVSLTMLMTITCTGCSPTPSDIIYLKQLYGGEFHAFLEAMKLLYTLHYVGCQNLLSTSLTMMTLTTSSITDSGCWSCDLLTAGSDVIINRYAAILEDNH